ncbi:MAG: DUF1129 domain-containing protein [Rhodobacteraceae bacterium]|nr:DUF1129 domain-containing protein [Paracoccaceae bacterium]
MEKNANREESSSPEDAGDDSEMDFKGKDGPIPQEVLNKIPEGAGREMIERSISMFASGPMMNPLAKKITAEHITKIIDNSAQDTNNEHAFRNSGRNYHLLYVLIAVAVFFGVTYLFAKENTPLYISILSHFGAVVAGFGAGWGFSKAKDD